MRIRKIWRTLALGATIAGILGLIIIFGKEGGDEGIFLCLLSFLL